MRRPTGMAGDEDEGPPRVVAEVRLEGRRQSARTGRDFLAATMESIGWQHRADGAVLILSELIANVVLHAGTDFSVRVWLVPGGLRVEVSDGSNVVPLRRCYAADAATGRGLRLVDRLSRDWGVAAGPHGKTVWYELSGERSAGGPTAAASVVSPRPDLDGDLDALVEQLGGWDGEEDRPASLRRREPVPG